MFPTTRSAHSEGGLVMSRNRFARRASRRGVATLLGLAIVCLSVGVAILAGPAFANGARALSCATPATDAFIPDKQGTPGFQTAQGGGEAFCSGANYSGVVKLYGNYSSPNYMAKADFGPTSIWTVTWTAWTACTTNHLIWSNIYANFGGVGHSDTSDSTDCNNP